MDGSCDGCRGATTTAVRLRDGRRLELCDGHARRHASALRRQGALIVGGAVITRPDQQEVDDRAPDLPKPPGSCRRAWRWLTDLSAQGPASSPPQQQKQPP